VVVPPLDPPGPGRRAGQRPPGVRRCSRCPPEPMIRPAPARPPGPRRWGASSSTSVPGTSRLWSSSASRPSSGGSSMSPVRQGDGQGGGGLQERGDPSQGRSAGPPRGGPVALRVRVLGSETVGGLTRFSLHHPRTRHYLNEWLYQRALADEDLIALQYGFVRVFLNDREWGLYALEEHFGNDLTRSQPAPRWPHPPLRRRALLESPLSPERHPRPPVPAANRRHPCALPAGESLWQRDSRERRR
jgi:hypothetical protein